MLVKVLNDKLEEVGVFEVDDVDDVINRISVKCDHYYIFIKNKYLSDKKTVMFKDIPEYIIYADPDENSFEPFVDDLELGAMYEYFLTKYGTVEKAEIAQDTYEACLYLRI